MSGSKPRVVVTGANGYLASLIRLYNADKFDFVNVTRTDVDLVNVEEVAEFFCRPRFRYLPSYGS